MNIILQDGILELFGELIDEVVEWRLRGDLS